MTQAMISGAYNSLWQLRADAWSSLEQTCERLVDDPAAGRRTEELTRRVGELFTTLDSIENYWAFPGAARFERLRRLFDNGDFTRLAPQVRSVNQALVTDSYRSAHAWRGPGSEENAEEAESAAA
jgi:hypothetical protein